MIEMMRDETVKNKAMSVSTESILRYASLFAIIFFVLNFKLAHAQTTVSIVGTLQDPSGAPIVSNGTFVRFSLRNFGGQIPGAPGIPAVVGWPDKDFTPDGSGNISGTIITNQAITAPNGTFYHVCIWYRNQLFRCNDYVINSAFDLNTAIPLNIVPNIGPGFNVLPCFVFQKPTTGLIWTITHNLNDVNTFVETADLNGIETFPPVGGANLSDPNVAVITWSSPQAGRAMVCHSTQLNIATNQPDAIVSHPIAPQTINVQPLSVPSLTDTELTVGKCVEADTGGKLKTISTSCAGASAGGTVTSVSDAGFPPLFTTNVANPTTPAITETAINQSANNFYAGPSGTAIDLVDFAIVNATGTASPLSISATPKASGDIAMVFTVQDSNNDGSFAPDVSWTASSLNTSLQKYYYKVVSGLATATASGTIGSAHPNWAATEALFTAKPTFTPTVTNQANINSGACNFTNQAIGFTPTAGRTLIVAVMSGYTSFFGGPVNVVSFTDSVGDIFAPLSQITNSSGRGTEITLLAAYNIIGGATTFNCSQSGGMSNGTVDLFEVSNIAPLTPTIGAMTVRRIVGADLPYPTKVSLGGILSKAAVTNQFLTAINLDGTVSQAQPSYSNLSGTDPGGIAVQVFSATTLGGDVSVSASTPTDVLARTVSMPASGCPCRAFLSYSLYITTSSSGVGYSAWVNDGSVNMAGTNAGQSNGSSGALASLTFGGYTTATYSNNASVTFTLRTEGDHTYTVRALSQVAGSAPNSAFQVGILTSN